MDNTIVFGTIIEGSNPSGHTKKGGHMNKILVTYFSASGVTKKAAQNIAKALNADLFEIEPKVKYTDKDLDWTDKKSRSTLEMKDKSSRPEIVKTVENLQDYQTIFLGFPVWWYTAPTIINTFLESTDFSGKTIIPFCTSGGSGILGSQSDLQKTYQNYKFEKGKRIFGKESKDFITDWIK